MFQGTPHRPAAAQHQGDREITRDGLHPVEQIIGDSRMKEVIGYKFACSAITARAHQRPVEQARRIGGGRG